ncbi:MAG TPA: hypothetical protein VGF12_11090 [Roseateles sp.]|uniref:hypothetical protein n=1 Tax=Roseateles sp. TaxID=1971397 RepID=UPI002EDAB916
MERSIIDGMVARAWHVYWRAVVGRDLVGSASLVKQIRTRLLGAHQLPGRELLYYLVLPGEIHLLSLLSAGDSAAALGNGLSNMIAKRVREADGAFGPVFSGRYRAQPIDSADQLLNEVRMLAWRPVSTGLSASPTACGSAALRTILGLTMADGFHATALLERLAVTVPLGRIALRRAIVSRPSEHEVLQWELTKGMVPARGTVGPAGAVARHVGGAAATLVAASVGKSIDGAIALLELWVQTRLGLHPDLSLAERKDFQGSRGRALVACLAVQCRLCSAASVARHFGRAKATLSERMAAIRESPADRAILATPMDKIVREAVELSGQR